MLGYAVKLHDFKNFSCPVSRPLSRGLELVMADLELLTYVKLDAYSHSYSNVNINKPDDKPTQS